MTQTGLMTVGFSMPMQRIDLSQIDLSALEHEVEPGVYEPVLRIEIDPSDEQVLEKVRLASWNVTSITAFSMKIQMVYENPLYISYNKADAVVLTFADPDLFISQTTGA